MSEVTTIKPYISAIIASIILIIVGYVTGNVSFGVGEYVLGTLEKALPNQTLPRLLQSSQISIIGTSLVLAGVSLVVITVSFMIRSLMRIPQSTET
ncbi:MAG: hypothetical protein QXO22_04265 [Thermosphaera sp.]